MRNKNTVRDVLMKIDRARVAPQHCPSRNAVAIMLAAWLDGDENVRDEDIIGDLRKEIASLPRGSKMQALAQEAHDALRASAH